MVHLHHLVAALPLLLSCSAVPLTLPIGNSGQSLTISDDGQTISMGDKTVNLQQAMNGATSCQSKTEGKASKNSTTVKSVTSAKTVYFISNQANNSIVALKVSANGTLSDGSITPTGGSGMTGVDSTGNPAVPDGLFSQGAIKISGNYMVAVNPGSNTVSLFHINPRSPTKLTMIGQPANTLGEFPVSVSISSSLQQACVANSGAVAGISCFSICPTKGLIPLDTAIRPFQLQQTTPPSGPLNTVSQVFFNQDSTMLLTTVKGDPTKNNTGFLSMFPISNGVVSRNEIRTSPSGTAVLFGTALLPDKNQIFATDASFGSATISLPASNSSNVNVATVSSSTKIADQKATCWATFSALTGTTFVTDVAVNHLVEVDPGTGQLITNFQSQNGNGGMIDLEGDKAGGLIFALSPGDGKAGGQGTKVAVFDVSGGKGSVKEMQNFAVGGVAGGSAQGMAVY